MKVEEEEEDGEEREAEAVTTATQRPKNKQRRSVASKVCYKEESSEGEEHSEEEEFLVSEEEEDSEGEATSRPDKKGKSRSEAPRRSRNIGGDEEEVVMEFKRKQGEGKDEWLEVYLEQAGEWVCLDVQQGNVDKPLLCSKRATQPLSYVLAVDGDGCLKDLGCRYDPTCMTASRKRRVDQEWWEETLNSFRSRASKRDQREDREVRGCDLEVIRHLVKCPAVHHPGLDPRSMCIMIPLRLLRS